MPNNSLKDLLMIERDSLKKKLDAVVAMLDTLDHIPTAVLGVTKPRKARSAAARKAQSERMKSFWAKKRAANKKSPNSR